MNVFAYHRISQGFHLIYKSDDSQEIEVCTHVVNKILQIKMYEESKRERFLKGQKTPQKTNTGKKSKTKLHTSQFFI